jgi:hypothetical protein
MRNQWKSIVMMAVLALFLGIAAPLWSQTPTPPLADPMAEDYSVHVIPFYKIDANWSAFLVIADTSYEDLNASGSTIHLTFYNAACNLVSDADLRITTADAQYFPLHDTTAANGQFNGIPGEGVILLDGHGVRGTTTGTPPAVVPPVHKRFLTYVLLINGNNNSLIRLDSIPCQGEDDPAIGGRQPCVRSTSNTAFQDGTWLRYDTFNTVAATFGDSDSSPFQTNLYFFSAQGDLETELYRYGSPRHFRWADSIHVDAWCNEVYLGSRRLDLTCTKRVPLNSLNYSRLRVFPDTNCAGTPGHIETWASDNGTDLVVKDYSGFQETIAELVPPTNLIGTGYYHHSGPDIAVPLTTSPLQ